MDFRVRFTTMIYSTGLKWNSSGVGAGSSRATRAGSQIRAIIFCLKWMEI